MIDNSGMQSYMAHDGECLVIDNSGEMNIDTQGSGKIYLSSKGDNSGMVLITPHDSAIALDNEFIEKHEQQSVDNSGMLQVTIPDGARVGIKLMDNSGSVSFNHSNHAYNLGGNKHSNGNNVTIDINADSDDSDWDSDSDSDSDSDLSDLSDSDFYDDSDSDSDSDVGLFNNYGNVDNSNNINSTNINGNGSVNITNEKDGILTKTSIWTSNGKKYKKVIKDNHHGDKTIKLHIHKIH